MWSIVDHFSTCILVLPRICKGDRKHSPTRAFSIQINRRVFHGRFSPKVSIDPFNCRIFGRFGPFGYQVIDIVGPVLDGRITHISAIQGKNFDNGCVQAIA